MASDDPDLHNLGQIRTNLAALQRHLEARDKLDRVLGTFLVRVGKGQLDPDDAAMRLQAAMEDRLVVAPVADRAAGTRDDRDRNRLIAEAQRAVQRRNLKRAIEIYVELCEQDPNDFRFRLKLGDCYARVGEFAKATATYLEIAAWYEKQGFFLKAVAVYKQILTMSGRQQEGAELPRETIADVHYMLASMYARLGLIVDARIQYEEFYRLAEEGDVRLVHVGEEIARCGGNPQGLRD